MVSCRFFVGWVLCKNKKINTGKMDNYIDSIFRIILLSVKIGWLQRE